MFRVFRILLLLIILTPIKMQAQLIVDTLINVGQHELHFNIWEGTGIPILFEAGNGDDGTVWEQLLRPIFDATGATLITYDRAGLGKSSIDTLNVNFQAEIKDLEHALEKLGYSKEIFMVSHSFGGFYSTLYAYRNRNKVKGTVFIDPALPCFFTKKWSEGFTHAISEENWAMIHQYKTGLYFVLKSLADISVFMEDKTMPETIPLTLIAAEKILPMVKESEIGKWKSCLQSFGSLSNHQYVLAKGAGHKVWEDDQQLVIEEILSLYRRVKEEKR